MSAQETSNGTGDQAQNPINKAAENIQQTANKAKESIQQTASQVGSEAQRVADNLQQTADKAKETVAQVSTDATHSAAEARRAMRESAYTVKETASTSLLNAAENIRREALKGGNEEVVRQAHQLARSMEKAALYLDSHTFEQIGTDAAEVVKENPWESLGVVFIIGLFLGMLFGGGNRD